MCTTCGCSSGELRIEGAGDGPACLRPFQALHPASVGYHFRTTRHANAQDSGGAATGAAFAPTSDLGQARKVQIEQDILSKNDRYAAENRRHLAARRILALNLLSSPGSGKTTLLTETIIALGKLHQRMHIAVIEGDQQTSNDADRIRATGAPAIQINTGKGCHLDAAMIATALERLAPPQRSVVMIENVGNLVCPAGFDLGEAHKVVVLSVTEGEDKPLKYPDMFRAASLMLLNKIDLLPYLRFDVAQCIANARRINPQIRVLQLSATTGQGMTGWLDWIETAFEASLAADE